MRMTNVECRMTNDGSRKASFVARHWCFVAYQHGLACIRCFPGGHGRGQIDRIGVVIVSGGLDDAYFGGRLGMATPSGMVIALVVATVMVIMMRVTEPRQMDVGRRRVVLVEWVAGMPMRNHGQLTGDVTQHQRNGKTATQHSPLAETCISLARSTPADNRDCFIAR